MNLPKYEDHELEFLEAMATKFCFSGKTKLAFIQRLLEANSDLEDNDLAEVLERVATGNQRRCKPRYYSARSLGSDSHEA
jgi:hypothetical protein